MLAGTRRAIRLSLEFPRHHELPVAQMTFIHRHPRLRPPRRSRPPAVVFHRIPELSLRPQVDPSDAGQAASIWAALL